MGARLAQLQVDEPARMTGGSFLEDEMADLRRKHLTPRSLIAADVAGENLELLEAAEERAARRLDRLGPVNPLAEQECAELEERATFLAEQRRDLEASLAQLQEVVSDLDQHIETSFAAIFETVKENFSAVIATVFPGAKGSLKLVEGASARPEEGTAGELEEVLADQVKPSVRGIGLEVKFPNKSPRSLTLLSGGDKRWPPSPFCSRSFWRDPVPSTFWTKWKPRSTTSISAASSRS